jgi:hypothetical protein
MRDYTSADTKRAKQAQQPGCLEWTPLFESAGCAGLGLIARDATLRGGALSGLLVDCNAAEQPVDVPCTRGTALSEERLSLRYGPSGLVGRVLESGHTVGEPIVAERTSAPAPAGASVLAGLLRARICGLRARICGAAVADVNWPSRTSVGVSQGQTGTNLCQVFAGADNAPRVANLAGRGHAAAVGEVAAGEGRGVARAAG